MRGIVKGLWVVLCCCSTILMGQSKGGFTKPSLFPQEMRLHLKNNQRTTAYDEGLVFLDWWQGGTYSAKQEDRIHKVCSYMKRKGYSLHKDFNALFRILNYYPEGNFSEDGLSRLLLCMEQYAEEGANRKLKSLLKESAVVLADSMLHRSNSFQWHYNRANINFYNDSVPVFEYRNTTLECLSRNDRFRIEGADGSYYPLKKEFRGTSGILDWEERFSLPSDSIYVELQNYRLDVRQSEFSADSVWLHSLYYLEQAELGTFKQKLSSGKSTRTNSFPYFKTYNNSLQLVDPFEDVDIYGGMEISGNRFYAAGSNDGEVEFSFYKDDIPFVKGHARRFLMRQDKLIANDAKMDLYIGGDSIWHPQVDIIYDRKERLFRSKRNLKDMGYAPYRSSYHKLDMYFEDIEWYLDSDSLILAGDPEASTNPVLFESSDYFSDARYRDTESMESVHPAFLLKKMINKNDGRRIYYLTDIASYYKITDDYARKLMISFAVFDFVKFDRNTGRIEIKDRLYDFLNSKLKRRDYDVIRFVSRKKTRSKAVIHIENKDMEVFGVNLVELSDSQKVVIFPYDQRIVVHQNRDFDFGGIVQSERFSLYGDDMDFNYDQFKINLNQIDSLEYQVETGRLLPDGSPILLPCKTVIQEIDGGLYVDSPNNKSGLKRYKKYPMLESTDNSYVYYDKIKNGIYGKEEFSFKVDPFKITGLNDRETNKIRFPGRLNAPGIFPTFKEVLALTEKRELGFDHKIRGSYPAYGKGKFGRHLVLDNSGLYGDGTITYLHSETETDQVYFYPEWATGDARIHLEESISSPLSYPFVEVEEAWLDWYPYKDVMEISSQEIPFSMFDFSYAFEGKIYLRPEVLNGSGILLFDNAISLSDNYRFYENKSEADDAYVQVFRTTPEPYVYYPEDKVLDAKHLTVSVDFIAQQAHFKSENSLSHFLLPKNHYRLSFDEMHWDMPKHTFEFQQTEQIVGGTLMSTLNSQKSIKYQANHAWYDMGTMKLDVDGVEGIPVADAIISPKDYKLKVEEYGFIEDLEDAIVYVQSDTKTDYVFHEAKVHIESQDSYTAQGIYEYVDLEGTVQDVFFNSISVDTLGYSKGVAIVPPSKNFRLDPYFNFRGKIDFHATKDFMHFDGDCRVSLDCISLDRAWIPFEDDLDPENIFIDLDPDVRRTDRQQWYTGFMMTHGPTKFYPAFLSNPNRLQDKEILMSEGLVEFDETVYEYRIANETRLKNSRAIGNYVSYNPDDCTVYAEGKMDLSSSNSIMETSSYGKINGDLEDNYISLDVIFSMDFLILQKALKIMRNDLVKEDVEMAINETDPFTQKYFKTILKKSKYKRYLRKRARGKGRLPGELSHTLFFSDLKLEWDPDRKVFINRERMGLNNIAGFMVNRKIRGFFELKPRSSGDQITIFFRSANHKYFFKYSHNVMEVYSTNHRFEKLIRQMGKRKRTVKGDAGDGDYLYEFVGEEVMQKFLKQY